MHAHFCEFRSLMPPIRISFAVHCCNELRDTLRNGPTTNANANANSLPVDMKHAKDGTEKVEKKLLTFDQLK